MNILYYKKRSFDFISLHFLHPSFVEIIKSRKKNNRMPLGFAMGLVLFFTFFLFIFIAHPFVVKAANTETFLVDSSYDAKGRRSITATNRFTGTNAYYFVDDFYWDSLNNQEQSIIITSITALSNEFDNVIYPNMHQFYGTEWNPGIDNDKRIFILLADIKNDSLKGSYGGYFSTTNEYSKNLLDEYKRNQLEILQAEKSADLAAGKKIDYYEEKINEINSIFSNEKELLYLNINFINKPSIRSFLAHEFQHMINWNEKTRTFNANEDIWLNESLSEYTSTILGYDNIYKGSSLELNVNDFSQNPSDPLTEWKNTNHDYSNVSIFMQYLAGRYGRDIIKTIITAPETGIAAIDKALRAVDPQASFSNVFSDWVVTNYFNDRIIQNTKYGYVNPDLNYQNLHIYASSSFMLYSNNIAKSSIVQSEEEIKSWTGKWYQFISSPILSVPNQTLKINFAAGAVDAKFQIPYVIENIGGELILKNYELSGDKSENIYIDNFGTVVKSVTIMPINEKISTDPAVDEIPVKFTYTASLISKNQPIIINFSPQTSELGNRTLVVIHGENFIKGAIVKFGGILATEVSVVDSTTIIAKAPPFYNYAEINVQIINPDATSAISMVPFIYKSQQQTSLNDGDLIRAEGDYKVYVVTGKYKRWIKTEEVFGFYNFKWSDVITVTPAVRDLYIASMLVRAAGDYKVYEIGNDGKKHHLSMSGAMFEVSGRKWEAIFIVNDLEKNYYKTGTIIAK